MSIYYVAGIPCSGDYLMHGNTKVDSYVRYVKGKAVKVGGYVRNVANTFGSGVKSGYSGRARIGTSRQGKQPISYKVGRAALDAGYAVGSTARKVQDASSKAAKNARTGYYAARQGWAYNRYTAKGISGKAGYAAGKIATNLEKTVKTIKEQAPKLISKAKDFISKLFRSTIPKAIKQVKSSDAYKKGKNFITDIFSKAGNFIRQAPGKIRNALSPSRNSVNNSDYGIQKKRLF